MRAERLEAQGIRSAGQLFKGLNDSGLPGRISSELYYHEKAHADADAERKGEFGFMVTSGWVVAYYVINGERTPEQLMKIASAPGFSNMSAKDWQIYNQAWKEFLRNKHEESFRLDLARDELREMLIEKLAAKLDELANEGRFPSLDKLLGYQFSDLVSEYGEVLYQAYKAAIDEVKHLVRVKALDEENEPSEVFPREYQESNSQNLNP